jgi:penicillin-binding protein 1A
VGLTVGDPHQTDTQPLAITHRRWRVGRPHRQRQSKWPKRVAVTLLCVFASVAITGVGLWVATPSVSDAPSRVAAILREHHGVSDNGAPPARVSAALVATEDSRFYSDHGLDPQSLVRAAWSVLRGGPGGGATLDAQLAKLLYSSNRSGLRVITEEAVLAIKLDQKYAKREILSMYLDAAYFGHGAYGVVTAARTYFGLGPDQLSWAQATLLAGLVNAPTAYDPTAHLHLAKERQRHVLDRLVATKALSAVAADEIYAEPLNPAVTFMG